MIAELVLVARLLGAADSECTQLNKFAATVCTSTLIEPGTAPQEPISNDGASTVMIGEVCAVPDGGGGLIATTPGAINDLPWLTEDGEVADGSLAITTLTLPDGTVVDTAWVSCTPTGQEPLTPAEPPSSEEIWDSVAAARPAIDLSPAVAHGGLVGLETRLWYGQPTTATTSLTLRGWTVTADLTAIRWTWDMGSPDIEGVSRYTSATPGTATDWVGSHVYETSGTHHLTITVTWSGTATFTGPVLFPVTTDLGQANLTTTAEYPVRQSVAVLTN